MTKLTSSLPLGLFVNGGNVLDKNILQGKIEFLLVKVNTPGGGWDSGLERHVQTAYDLDIPCGLVIYMDGTAPDKNWDLNDFSKWNRDRMVGQFLPLPGNKRFHFGVLYYHPSRMVEANGAAIEPQWLAQIPIYMADELHNAWFGPLRDVPAAARRMVIGGSDAALSLVADPNTAWRDWPFMSVVDAFGTVATWETIRDLVGQVEGNATQPGVSRPLWNFDPYPSHGLPGTGNAGLVSWLGTKKMLHDWCQFVPAGTIPTPDPDPDPDPGSGGSVDISAIDAKLQAIVDMLEPISVFFARFK